MQFSVKGRMVNFEPAPAVLSSLILGWAIYYYFSTLFQPDVGPQSVLFIKPLVLIIIVAYIFVIISCLKIGSPAVDTLGAAEGSKKIAAHAFRRFTFVLSLAAYAAAITFFGYLIPSILFMSFVCFYLGMRKIWLLALLAIGIPSLLAVVFKFILGVPLPILPSWELFL